MRTILITGASSGIGKSLGIKFAKNNWKVIALSRSKPSFPKLITKKIRENIIFYPLDITKKTQVKVLFKSIFSTYGSPDIFFLNAGTNNPNSKKIINLNETIDIFNINYFGTLNCIEAILNFKEKNLEKFSQLIIMASVAGYRGLPNAAAYCSSKAALIATAESIYNQCRLVSLKVRIVNPGFVKTPLTDKNRFPMPLIISSEKAAKIIYNKLLYSKSFEISLPWLFCFVMKIFRVLPYLVYFKITNLMIKKL